MSTSLQTPVNLPFITGADQEPTANLVVSTKFMETYEIIRSVSGGGELSTFLNGAGNLDIYSVGTANKVSRIRPDSDAKASWTETALNITARQLSIYPNGFDQDNPNILGLDNEDMLTLGTYQSATGQYKQAVSQPPDSKKKIKQFLGTKGVTGNIYANVILENDEVATSFLKLDGTWASKDWAPIKTALGSTENAKVKKIAMCANNPVQVALYAIGVGGKIENAVLFSDTNTRFSSFTRLGTLKAIDLAVAQDSDELLNIFAIDINFKLWWKKEKKYSSGPTTEWEDWKQLDKTVPLSSLRLVINAQGELEVFATGDDGLLYHTHQMLDSAGKFIGWSTLFPLGNPVPNSIFAVGRNDDGYSEAYSVTNDNRLYRFWQNPTTTQWYNYEILLKESGEMASVPTHSVEVTALDYGGLARPDVNVQIKASTLIPMRINGLYYIASEFKTVTLKTNPTGTLAIDIGATSLTAPSLYITTDYTADGAGVVVQPNGWLKDKMQTTTKEDVWNAKTKDGQDLLRGEYRTEENAEHIAKIMQKSMSLGDPASTALATLPALRRGLATRRTRHTRRGHRPSPFLMDVSRVPEQHWQVDFSSGAPRYRELTRSEATALIAQKRNDAAAAPEGWFGIDWGGLWNSIKEGFGSIVGAIKDFIVTTIIDPISGLVKEIQVKFSLLIDNIMYVIDTVITAFQQAFDIVEGIWNKIKVFFEELYEWLAFLFAWGDIQRTAEVVKHTFNVSFDFLQLALHALKDRVEEGIRTLEGNIKSATDEFLKTISGQETFGQYTDKYNKPQPAVSSSSSHNVLLNAFGDNYESAKVTATMRTFESGGPLDALMEKLIQLSDNFQFGEGKQAFDEALSYFSAIGSDPDNVLKLIMTGVIKVMESITLFAVELAGGIILSIIDIIADILQLIKDMLNEEWEIPFVSQLYKLITGKSLSFQPIYLFSLIVAVPTTILYKIVKDEAPYPNDESVEAFKQFFTAEWLAQQSGIIPKKALTEEEAQAQNEALEVCRRVFIIAFTTTYAVRTVGELVQLVWATRPGGAPFELNLFAVFCRFLNSVFSIPWIVSLKPDTFNCAFSEGFSEWVWLYQLLFGPGLGFFVLYMNRGEKKLPKETNDIRLTIWGAGHLLMFVFLAVHYRDTKNPDKIAMNVLTCLAPQLFRFCAIDKVMKATRGISGIALGLMIFVTYPAIAGLNYTTNLGEADLAKVNSMERRDWFWPKPAPIAAV
ncbi:MAG TPA: hypothetical protein VF538_02020 [Pyrinomonadaceae bacterium]|jgi:hypothetical protein